MEDEGAGEEAVGALRKAGGGASQDPQGLAEEDPESHSGAVRVPKCRSDLRTTLASQFSYYIVQVYLATPERTDEVRPGIVPVLAPHPRLILSTYN